MSYMKMINGAFGTLSSGIDTDDTAIILTGGHGSRFPSLAAGQCFVATLSNKPANKRETVLVTARSTDTLTVIRAFGDSTAKDWASNDRISIRWDRTMAMQYAVVGGMSEYLQGGGSADAITATLDTLQTTLIDGTRVFVEITTGKNNGNATFTLGFDRTEWGGGVTSGTTKTLSRSFVSAVPLVEGDIPGSNFVAEFVYSAAIDRWVLVNPSHGGLARQYREGVDDDYALISGGNAVDAGARMELFGQSHATLAGVARFTASEWRALVTGLFDVSDEGGNTLLRVTDAGVVTGTALALLADLQASDNDKLVTPQGIEHHPCVPKHMAYLTRVGDSVTTVQTPSGGVSVAYAQASSSGTVTVTFTDAFANTSYVAMLLMFDGAGAARMVRLTNSNAATATAASLNTPWPSTTGTVLLLAWGNKASL